MDHNTAFTPASMEPAALLAEQLRGLSAASAPVLAAIDGRCGSGKSTLAAEVSRLLENCPVIHTDDFYLPFDRRRSGWQRIPCANMDLARLREEILMPLRSGGRITYRAYSCGEGSFLPERILPEAGFYLIEGSYSHHPTLRAFYDLRVFLTCSPDAQKARLQAREGSNYANFLDKWIPLEEGYFAEFQIPEQADLVLTSRTGGFMTGPRSSSSHNSLPPESHAR